MPKAVVTAALAIGLAMLAASASAQPPSGPAASAPAPRRPVIPTVFTNLQVLPKDISRPDLLGVMKSMSNSALKIRCNSCHAVSDDLTEGDFASDEKPAKLEARKMLRAILNVRSVNQGAPSSP